MPTPSPIASVHPDGHGPREVPPTESRPLRAWPWAVAALALGHPLCRLLASWDWRADLLVHLQLPALALSLVAAASVARRNRRAAFALAALAAWQAWPLVHLWGPDPVRPDPRSGERLRVLVANVQLDNVEYGRLAEWIGRERPDLVALIEFTPDWRTGLEDVRRAYPYRVESPTGADGLALWSRRPLRSGGPIRASAEGWPALPAELDFAGRPLRVWVVHPSPPVWRRGRFVGFPELDALGAWIGREAGPRLVVGDLNTTEASPHFAEFLRLTGLRDSRRGFGPQPSWPAGLPYRIALDHALVSPELAVVDRRLGPRIGSDHLPFVVVLAPAAASRTSAASASQASSSH